MNLDYDAIPAKNPNFACLGHFSDFAMAREIRPGGACPPDAAKRPETVPCGRGSSGNP